MLNCLLASLSLMSFVSVEAPETINAQLEIDVVGQSQVIFGLPNGAYTITELNWLPAEGSSDHWKSARLRILLDTKEPSQPKVDQPLSDFVLSALPKSRSHVASRPRFGKESSLTYQHFGRLLIDAKGPVRGQLKLLIRSRAGD